MFLMDISHHIEAGGWCKTCFGIFDILCHSQNTGSNRSKSSILQKQGSTVHYSFYSHCVFQDMFSPHSWELLYCKLVSLLMILHHTSLCTWTRLSRKPRYHQPGSIVYCMKMNPCLNLGTACLHSQVLGCCKVLSWIWFQFHRICCMLTRIARIPSHHSKHNSHHCTNQFPCYCPNSQILHLLVLGYRKI